MNGESQAVAVSCAPFSCQGRALLLLLDPARKAGTTATSASTSKSLTPIFQFI
jgi:hypothetical protein